MGWAACLLFDWGASPPLDLSSYSLTRGPPHPWIYLNALAPILCWTLRSDMPLNTTLDTVLLYSRYDWFGSLALHGMRSVLRESAMGLTICLRSSLPLFNAYSASHAPGSLFGLQSFFVLCLLCCACVDRLSWISSVGSSCSSDYLASCPSGYLPHVVVELRPMGRVKWPPVVILLPYLIGQLFRCHCVLYLPCLLSSCLSWLTVMDHGWDCGCCSNAILS